MPSLRRALFPLALFAAMSAARGDDPAPPKGPDPAAPGGKPAPGGQPPGGAQPAPPPDPVREQAFQDKAAEDALVLIRKPGIADAMEGIDRLSKLHSSKATSGTIDAVLARSERHVAEFAGFALACADPQGTLTELAARLSGPKAIKNEQLEQMASLLAEIPADEADKLLAHDRILHSSDTAVRREAIRGLGWHRSALGIETTIEALGNKDPELRNVACVALGRIGDKRAVVPLLGKLGEKDGTGGFAAIALGRIEDERIFPEVVARLASAGYDAGKALVAAARPQHAEKLVSLARGKAEDTKIAACAALAKIRNRTIETQKQLLDAMLTDSSRWVRIAAFQALGQCATPELAPFLAKRMGQKDDELLRYVWEIAGDISAKECVEPIVEAMWTQRNDVLRRIAIDAFWRIRDPASMTAAEEKIRKATGKSVERAAEVLALRRNRNGFDLAVEMLDSHKRGSREQFLFELTLEKQTGHFFGPDITTWREWIEKNPKFFEKEQAAIERAKWREEFLKENAGTAVTPATEQSVQAALDFLARHQSPDGAFDQQHFLALCTEKDGCPTSAGARVQMDPVGMTALCTLAYFGAGCGPSKGRYRGVVARAMEYLLSRQMPNGDYANDDLIGGYNRPIVLQAYAEAEMASVEDPQYLPFVQRGVDFLASIQAEKGGWRYRVVDNANDTSVVAWVLFASKAAEKAKARVRRSIFEGCDLVLTHDQVRPVEQREDFIRDIDPNYAFDVSFGKPYYEFHTGYQDDKFTVNQATTALGLMSRILLGYRRSHPFCIGSANQVLAKQVPPLPKKPGDFNGYTMTFQYPMYAMYYGTLAMHQMGGKYFSQWDKVLREVLPGTQEKTGCQRGSWASWGVDGIFSRLYTTAIGAMTLETYYRYAPILQD
jgi:HEAT repeat protein